MIFLNVMPGFKPFSYLVVLGAVAAVAVAVEVSVTVAVAVTLAVMAMMVVVVMLVVDGFRDNTSVDSSDILFDFMPEGLLQWSIHAA